MSVRLLVETHLQGGLCTYLSFILFFFLFSFQGWAKTTAHNALLGPIPVAFSPHPSHPCHSSIPSSSSSLPLPPLTPSTPFEHLPGQKEICGFSVPELDLKTLEIITPINGTVGVNTKNRNNVGVNGAFGVLGGNEVPYSHFKKLKIVSDDLLLLLELEKNWDNKNRKIDSKLDLQLLGENRENRENRGNRGNCENRLSTESTEELIGVLAAKWTELLSELDPSFRDPGPSDSSDLSSEHCGFHPLHLLLSDSLKKAKKIKEEKEFKDDLIRIPIGESVILSATFRNRLSTKVALNSLCLEIAPSSSSSHPSDLAHALSSRTSHSHPYFRAVPPSSIPIGSGGVGHVLVQASPRELGEYQVRARLRVGLRVGLRVELRLD